MHLRKNRVPVQGMSNFNSTHPHLRQLSSNLSTPLQTVRSNNDNSSFQPKTVKLNLGQKNKTCDVTAVQVNNNSLNEIRKIYKGKSNVWRMAKSWKFTRQGFIDKQELKHHMQKTMGIKMPEHQIQAIVSKFGSPQGKIDIQNFCKIIYGENTSFSYKPRLFNVQDEKKNRTQKINNLIDKLDVYQNAINKKSRHQSQDIVLPLAPQNSSINHNRISKVNSSQKNPFDKKDDKQNYNSKQNCVISKQKTESLQKINNTQMNKYQFFALTQNSFDKLRKSKKNYDLHPSNLVSQNQTKTRFGATFNNTSQGFYPHKDNTQKNLNTVSTIQKEEKKQKLETRLQKLRQTQQIQRSNIQKAQQRENQRQNGRLLRKRLQKQAYQYSSYLRNKWL